MMSKIIEILEQETRKEINLKQEEKEKTLEHKNPNKEKKTEKNSSIEVNPETKFKEMHEDFINIVGKQYADDLKFDGNDLSFNKSGKATINFNEKYNVPKNLFSSKSTTLNGITIDRDKIPDIRDFIVHTTNKSTGEKIDIKVSINDRDSKTDFIKVEQMKPFSITYKIEKDINTNKVKVDKNNSLNTEFVAKLLFSIRIYLENNEFKKE